MHNSRKDRTTDADESRRARGPDPVHPEPQAIVATTSNPHSNSKCISARLVFSKSVVQLIYAMKAVHLEPKTSTSLGAPTALFEAIELRDALKEDAPGWREAILAKARSL